MFTPQQNPNKHVRKVTEYALWGRLAILLKLVFEAAAPIFAKGVRDLSAEYESLGGYRDRASQVEAEMRSWGFTNGPAYARAIQSAAQFFREMILAKKNAANDDREDPTA
jgi:hypothetical protein